jgi:hypothetical protein
VRILITNASLGAVGGTQAYVRDLASWLLDQGHSPIVYGQQLGETARQLQRRTIPVVDDLNDIGVRPDVIHGNSAAETMIALLHFPNTPATFVCHGWAGIEGAPPKFPRVLRYIAVDDTCADRLLLSEGIPIEQCVTVLNAVDVRRFRQRPTLPARPQRALVFSNTAHEMTHLPIIRRACSETGIEVDVVGRYAGTAVEHPEEVLGRYDLVFAKAKCAIEAMAVGTAVIVCDANGLGGLVRYSELSRMRRSNFGIRVMDQPNSVSALRREIDAYDASDARRVSDVMRSTADAEDAHREILGVLEAVVEEFATLPPSAARGTEGPAAAEFLRRRVQAARARPDLGPLVQGAQRLLATPVVGGAMLAVARLLSRRRSMASNTASSRRH